jgi:hypothetical protein
VPAPAALVVDFVFALTAYVLVARWYLLPALAGRPLRSSLPPLLLIHLVRPISLWLLVPGVIVKRTIPIGFAQGTAIGDLIAAVLALVAVFLVRSESKLAIPAVWLFNIVGFVDVLRNCLMGLMLRSPDHMGAAVLIPAFGVPAIIVSHGLIFKLLWDDRRRKSASEAK